ncbi:putative glycerol-3-phosphate transporter 4 [Spatholobus suberectus]|nr:putative glycerol-3-phosphate transporter 4 [Spatholobus suberectus]
MSTWQPLNSSTIATFLALPIIPLPQTLSALTISHQPFPSEGQGARLRMSRHCDGRTPPGMLLTRGKERSLHTHRYMVLLITFAAYACYHASRKPTGIVKSVLCPEHKGSDRGWSPFNGRDGTSKLGEIDVAFLACYALGCMWRGTWETPWTFGCSWLPEWWVVEYSWGFSGWGTSGTFTTFGSTFRCK